MVAKRQCPGIDNLQSSSSLGRKNRRAKGNSTIPEITLRQP